MRKKDIINTDYIIDDMYLSVSHAANGYVNLDNYVDITDQNVLVRLHTPSTYVNYHAHDCFEINYVYRGNCINLVENNLHFMDEGDLIILHPDAYHNLYSPNESKIFNFLIRKDWFFNVLNTYKLDASPVSTFIEYSTKKNHYDYIMCSCSKDSDSAKSKIRKLAVNLIKKSQSDGPTRFLLMESAAIEFFCALVTECKTASLSSQNNSESKTVTDLLSYISEHYNTVTLDSLSSNFGYSKTHICRLFKQHLGKSFVDIVTELRINYAKSCLINTNMLVKDICFKCGYNSVEYFQRLFKSAPGLAPGEYRKSVHPNNLGKTN